MKTGDKIEVHGPVFDREIMSLRYSDEPRFGVVTNVGKAELVPFIEFKDDGTHDTYLAYYVQCVPTGHKGD